MNGKTSKITRLSILLIFPILLFQCGPSFNKGNSDWNWLSLFALSPLLVGEETVPSPDQPATAPNFDHGSSTGLAILSQDFNGIASGSPWPAGWVNASGPNVVSATIQDGRACLEAVQNNGNSQTTLARMVNQTISARDIEISVTVQYEDFYSQGVGLYGRQNGEFLDVNPVLGAGYALFVEGSNGACMGLWYEENGIEYLHECTAPGDVLNYDFTPGGLAANSTFNYRFQIRQISGTQTMQQAKMWLEGDSEPAQWQVFSDNNNIGGAGDPMSIPALQNITGSIALDLYNYFYNPNTVRSACFDNLVVKDLSPSPIAGIQPVQEIAGGFNFIEGPTWIAGSQTLLFTDIETDRIHQLDPATGQVTTIRDTQSPMRHGNGLALDQSGNLLICEQSSQSIIRRHPNGDEETLAATYNGVPFNSPNDLSVHSNGNIYFTDPGFGILFNPALVQVQDENGVYRLTPAGVVSRLNGTFNQPNGIALSPDQTRLYVSDYTPLQLRAFQLVQNGALVAEIIDSNFPITPGGDGGDGLAVDTYGNIYVSTPTGVAVFDAPGNALGVIPVSGLVRNIAFGGADMKTLFIASSTNTSEAALFSVQLNLAGLSLP